MHSATGNFVFVRHLTNPHPFSILHIDQPLPDPAPAEFHKFLPGNEQGLHVGVTVEADPAYLEDLMVIHPHWFEGIEKHEVMVVGGIPCRQVVARTH